MRRFCFLAAIFSFGIGCTTIPAGIAADYDTFNKNVQKFLPRIEAQAAQVEADPAANADAVVAAKHDHALSAATRLLGEKLGTYIKNHSNQDDVAAIHSNRISASTPTTTGRGR